MGDGKNGIKSTISMSSDPLKTTIIRQSRGGSGGGGGGGGGGCSCSCSSGHRCKISVAVRMIGHLQSCDDTIDIPCTIDMKN